MVDGIPEQARAALLAVLPEVDHVLVFDEETPHNLLRAIRPDVLVKGGTTPVVIGRGVVEAYGGTVLQTDERPGVSTSTILAGCRTPPRCSRRPERNARPGVPVLPARAVEVRP